MPVYIGVDDLKDTATNEMLEQGYVVAESDVRLRILYTFLKKNKTKKMMVFFSSCMSVKFHYEVLEEKYTGKPAYKNLHNLLRIVLFRLHIDDFKCKSDTNFF